MATTVNNAFSEFLRDMVNLDEKQTKMARKSRDNLIDNITKFSGNEDFFVVYDEKNLKFGSFARHTKIRPLDDIDLMICFSGEGIRTYFIDENCIYINGSFKDKENGLLMDDGTWHLNSTKVINRLVTKLADLNDYSKAEMHKNHEAATLQLKSYTWNFDIVPCFYTDTGLYLIPDGSKNWKRTDPRVDKKRIQNVNKKHKGKILDIIRLMKYWNNRRITLKMGSYLLESMILSYYEGILEKEFYYPDIEVKTLFYDLSSRICSKVPDPKGLQGDLNTFSFIDREKIRVALHRTAEKAQEAINLEINAHNQKNAINKWREIFGDAFPKYTEASLI